MSEKNVVSRTVAIRLVILYIILAVGLLGIIISYTSIINSKDSYIQSKDSQIQILTNEKYQLQSWLDRNETLLSYLQTWLDENTTYYNTQIDSLNSQILVLTDQNNQLNSQITNLQNQISDLNTQISLLTTQITNLQNQVNTLKTPKLIGVNLKGDDNGPFWDKLYLKVYGYVCNVGTNTAYNSKIHVILYQSGGVVANNTYITLGTINGESWISVDSKVYFDGPALTGWNLTLEWTS